MPRAGLFLSEVGKLVGSVVHVVEVEIYPHLTLPLLTDITCLPPPGHHIPAYLNCRGFGLYTSARIVCR